MGIEFCDLPDRPPAGWFVFEVARWEARKRDWVVFMVDIEPDPGGPLDRRARGVWVRIPGKHRDREAAWDALEDMLATRP